MIVCSERLRASSPAAADDSDTGCSFCKYFSFRLNDIFQMDLG